MTPALGFSTAQDPEVVKFLDTVETSVTPLGQRLFPGLGTLKEEDTIRLVPRATPYILSVPRRIPISLWEVVRAKLSKMEKQGVIRRVYEPTE